jgi:hypothetical protein
MADVAAIAGAIIAGLTAVDSNVQGRRAAKAQDKQQDQALRLNSEANKKAEEEMNRMNMKKPDISKMRAANSMASSSTTLLTSPTGTGDKSLGKTTLLGG